MRSHSTRLLAAVAGLLATEVAAVEPQSFTDKFDVSRGTEVTGHSTVVSSIPEGMFGNSGGSPEPGVTFFLEGPEGTIHFIEWSTAEPVLIDGFNVFASGDSPSAPERRTFDHFTLQAKVEDVYVTIHDQDVTVPYEFLGPGSLVISTPLEVPIIASEFRAEFRQHLEGSFHGPRLYELDGYGGEVCGDANYNVVITSSDALAALRTSVGSSSCALCVCDVDESGGVVASDALAILRTSVGSGRGLDCPVCYLGQD